MLDFLNEVLMIEDLEPDAYQMGISGKSGAKMKAPDGGKASMKGDFNALHPRYPKGHPQGGKFMPKGSKDQINAVAKAKGVSTEQAAAMVGGKAPANKGKLKKFSGSAGAVGKAQKVLKDKNATPEQRAKAKASIQKAAMKMRGDTPMIADKPKRGKISNKEIMARNAGTSAPKKGSRLSKFGKSAGAVGKAQKVLKDKNSTPEQRAKATASIAKAASKMRGESPVVAEKPKRGKISNKEIMARNTGTSAPVPTPIPSGSVTQDVSKKAVQQRAKRSTTKEKIEPIKNYDDFKGKALTAFRDLNEDFNYSGLVPIHQVRDALGSSVSKEDFDKYLQGLQRDDLVQLQGQSSMIPINAEQLKKSYTDSFGETRTQIKLLDTKALSGLPKRKDQGKSKISQKDFEGQLTKAYIEKSKTNSLVPIYQLRRELGDKVSRNDFNNWVLKMQEQDKFQLVTGGAADITPDKERDSITTELGGLRYYIRKT